MQMPTATILADAQNGHSHAHPAHLIDKRCGAYFHVTRCCMATAAEHLADKQNRATNTATLSARL